LMMSSGPRLARSASGKYKHPASIYRPDADAAIRDRGKDEEVL
jgi:hypothetical protein